MKIKMSLVLGIMFSFILISTGLIFSQDEAAEKPPAEEVPSEPETLWIWGEVVSVDAAAKKVLVKYLDYETDTEKEINIVVDDKTTYENVKSVDEIKPQDTLSIDYMISPDGSNIARNISVEKPEGIQTLPEGSIKEEPKAVPGLE
jgi:hypothetical protein